MLLAMMLLVTILVDVRVKCFDLRRENSTSDIQLVKIEKLVKKKGSDKLRTLL
jgi:hypothetical protein